eukprot:GEMP01005399.1.p2 GENE.GEMP01005399.1~~GEMP01005399.1.p2  ORF type:complete len:410 (+),score=101.65 GEMP01005399.1:145-1374(+)
MPTIATFLKSDNSKRSSTSEMRSNAARTSHYTIRGESARQGLKRRHTADTIPPWNSATGRNDDEVDVGRRSTVMVRLRSFVRSDAREDMERRLPGGVEDAGELTTETNCLRSRRTFVMGIAQQDFYDDDDAAAVDDDGDGDDVDDDDVTSVVHMSQSDTEVEEANGREPNALGTLADGLQALFTQLDDATAQRERHIDRIENNLWDSIPATSREQAATGGNSTGTSVLSAMLPEFARQFGDFLPDFLLPDKHAHSATGSPSAARPFPVSTTPTAAHDMPCIRVEDAEVALSGFVMLAPSHAPSSEKVRGAKNIPIRWAQITKGPENEWMLLWYHARYPSRSDEKDDERFSIIDGMSIDKNSVRALTTLTGSSIIDHGVEAMTRDGSVVMHFFSVYPPPDVAKRKTVDAG